MSTTPANVFGARPYWRKSNQNNYGHIMVADAGWVDEFCAVLDSTEIGRCFLSNLAVDIENGKLAPHVLRQFLADIHARTGGSFTATTVCSEISEVLKARPRLYNCRAVGSELNCKCASIMDAWVFLRYYVMRQSIRGRVMGDRTGTPCFQQHQLNEVIVHISHQPEKYISRPFLAKEKYLLWITPQDDLEEIRERVPRDQLASSLRHKLGLSHHRSRAQFVEVSFSRNKKVRRPTALDGGIHEAFRSNSAAASKWGRAMDLQTGGKGLREAVAPPTNSLKSVRLRPAGLLTEHDVQGDVITAPTLDRKALKRCIAVLKGSLNGQEN